jgi:hypothetical protein
MAPFSVSLSSEINRLLSTDMQTSPETTHKTA